MINNSKIGHISQVIEIQCSKCKYWHDDVVDEQGLEWAPFCDLFHGNGIAYPCEQFTTPSLQSSETFASYRKSEEKPKIGSTGGT